MSNSLKQIFSDQELSKIRTMEIDGKQYFVGIDVARLLGYSYPHKAIEDICKEVLRHNVQSGNRICRMLVIPESDIHRFMEHYRNLIAKRYKSQIPIENSKSNQKQKKGNKVENAIETNIQIGDVIKLSSSQGKKGKVVKIYESFVCCKVDYADGAYMECEQLPILAREKL